MSLAATLLERLAALIHQSVRDDAARHGLLPIQLQVLAYLAQANHYSDIPIAVAEYFGVTRGTVSQTLSVLERRGLVAKRPDSKHGKRIHLHLTEAGRALLKDSWANRLARALEEAPGVEEETLEEGLRGFLVALQRQNHHRAFNVCKHCVHFLEEAEGYRCGLTKEPLAVEQTLKICREWTPPGDKA
ncbi:MarR family winged helix-turn-helix transcriptional regulator [Pistricoccus aurantiacus]|uniref:MarR family winged helix-turn-helix transcriptional regulator n=1 Tax=Pistricoccus aurantiacus TaxID=1883414 RepID=UPI00362F43C8